MFCSYPPCPWGCLLSSQLIFSLLFRLDNLYHPVSQLILHLFPAHTVLDSDFRISILASYLCHLYIHIFAEISFVFICFKCLTIICAPFKHWCCNCHVSVILVLASSDCLSSFNLNCFGSQDEWFSKILKSGHLGVTRLWILLRWLSFIGCIWHCCGQDGNVTVMFLPGGGRPRLLSKTPLALEIGRPLCCWRPWASGAHQASLMPLCLGRVEITCYCSPLGLTLNCGRGGLITLVTMHQLTLCSACVTHSPEQEGGNLIATTRNGSWVPQMAFVDTKGRFLLCWGW